MDYQTLKREMQNYPDTMTNAERMKAYAMGQEVDRIPFTLGGAHSLVRLYGYTPGQFRRSLDVQFELAEKIKSDFCGSGMAASTATITAKHRFMPCFLSSFIGFSLLNHPDCGCEW